MNREEGINKAAVEYCNSTDPILMKSAEYNFKKGTQWADNNPKSPWISVKYELPCDNPNNIHFGFTNRVLATDGENIFVAYMKKDKDNKWIWCSEDNVDISHIITHWMPFPEPPKE